MEIPENKIQSAADLFGRVRIIKKEGKPESERASLIRYFLEQNFKDKEGKKLEASAIGVRLAHYSLDQLYALQSSYKDRLHHDGLTTARKWWWFTTRTTNV